MRLPFQNSALMSCKRIQELLLTDYSDGESDSTTNSWMENHLSQCHSCREYHLLLRQGVMGPLAGLTSARPPESIWEEIRRSITREAASPCREFSCAPYKVAFATTLLALVLYTSIAFTRSLLRQANRPAPSLQHDIKLIYYLSENSTLPY